MTITNNNILEHQGLVKSIAKSFYPNSDTDMQEYVQEGNIALLKALRKYDKKRGKISTFARKCIIRAISRYISKQNKIPLKQVDIDPEFVESLKLWEILPNNLDDIENNLIIKRCDGYTFEEIGKEFGHTKSWAKQKLNIIIKKIQEANKVNE